MVTELADLRPRAQLTAADWRELAAELDANGCARTPQLLSPAQCRELVFPFQEQGHGISTVRSGCRHALGLVFHDA